MPTPAKNTRATIIPGLKYQNAPAMIDWLVQAFGFEKQAVYPGPDNTIAHAQLTFGNGMIMLGSTSSAPEPQSPYLIVSDCEAIYASAKAAGAQIVMELEVKDYGGSGFTCKDPEGHIWSIGTYDPWDEITTTPTA